MNMTLAGIVCGKRTGRTGPRIQHIFVKALLTPGSLPPDLQELGYFQFPPSINFDKIKNLCLVICRFVQKSLSKCLSPSLRMLIQLLTQQLWDGFHTVVLSPKIKLRTLSLLHLCLNFLINLPFFPLKIFT